MINAKIMKTFINKVTQEVDGEWIIIGGSLLPLLGIESRVTVDIDFAPLTKTDQQLELLKVAEKMGLPIEVINSACSFYISGIKDIKKQCILYFENSNCRIFRPSFNLYLNLKLNRSTESDISDCLNYAHYCYKNDDVDWSEAYKFIQKKIIQVPTKKESLKDLFLFIQKKHSKKL